MDDTYEGFRIPKGTTNVHHIFCPTKVLTRAIGAIIIFNGW